MIPLRTAYDLELLVFFFGWGGVGWGGVGWGQSRSALPAAAVRDSPRIMTCGHGAKRESTSTKV